MGGERLSPPKVPPPPRGARSGAAPLRARDEPEESTAGQVVARSAPPWLVSLLAHCLLILILAVIAFRADPSLLVRLQSEFSERIGEQLIDDSVEIEAEEPVEEVEEEVFVPLEEPEVEEPIAATEPIEESNDLVGPKPIEAPVIGMALDGRDLGSREALLKAYGGDARTEEAVALALRWLARQQQRRTGLWSMTGPYTDGAATENVPAATAMALLAFQGAGNTHHRGDYRNNVSRGWVGLLKYQTPDGDFFEGIPRSERVENHRMYTNALCTIALCELYGMTDDSYYFEPAQRAVDYLVRNQSSAGGWRYQPKVDSDLSVSGWCMMALQSARMAGIIPPEIAFRDLERFLDGVAFDDGARYFYQDARQATEAMTAEGLLCRQYLGWDRYDDRLARGVEYLRKNPIDYDQPNVYYWYYATQVLHHYEGDPWWEWNGRMKKLLPAAQVQERRERGSWDPENDRWGANRAGRLYVTCLSTYMLEVYYRHLPLYRIPESLAAR